MPGSGNDPILLHLAAVVMFALGPTVAEASNETPPPVSMTMRTNGVWTVVESPNFRCYCRLAESDARRLAECCETWRSRLRKTWIAGAVDVPWSLKCDVYVHPDRAAYNRSLNRPGDTSVGSTIMNFDQGRVVMRRIEVRADAVDWSNSALAHELTHVVLGDRFGGHSLPRWADEGIAMLSESDDKRRVRLANLQETLSHRSFFSMGDLVRLDRMPQPHLRDAFYGQSVALTSLLIRKSTPAQFADFVEETQQAGLESALKKHYRIDGLVALQSEWDQWTRRPETIEFADLELHAGIRLAAVTAP